MNIQSERKFLHNLANPMAIAQGNIKLVLRKLLKNSESLSTEEIIDRLSKASDAFDRITDMMAERRTDVIQAEEKVNSQVI